jgi:putative FmdB family regulatory protein
MPIYEYRCTECQQLFEEWCKHVEDSGTIHNCPICKGQAHRIMSNTSFALKGGGWYATEYGSRRKEGESDTSASCSNVASSEAPAACASSGSCAGAGACNAAIGTSA